MLLIDYREIIMRSLRIDIHNIDKFWIIGKKLVSEYQYEVQPPYKYFYTLDKDTSLFTHSPKKLCEALAQKTLNK